MREIILGGGEGLDQPIIDEAKYIVTNLFERHSVQIRSNDLVKLYIPKKFLDYCKRPIINPKLDFRHYTVGYQGIIGAGVLIGQARGAREAAEGKKLMDIVAIGIGIDWMGCKQSGTAGWKIQVMGYKLKEKPTSIGDIELALDPLVEEVREYIIGAGRFQKLDHRLKIGVNLKDGSVQIS